MNFNVTNKTYDFLNALVRVILPGLGALYFALSQFWPLPNAVEVVGSISAICLFGGLVIVAARQGWKVDDELLIHRGDGQVSFGFAGGTLLEELKTDQTLVLHVKEVGSETEVG